jgi:hypothetical protein
LRRNSAAFTIVGAQMRRHLRSLALPIVIPLLLAACAASVGSTTQPTPVVSGIPIPVGSAAAAAARVVAAYPQFAGIGPLNNDAIGQCCWYDAVDAPGAYQVTIHVGWGDCPAGCIDKHEWVFTVSPADGAISLVAEKGSPVPAGVPGAGGVGGVGSGTGPTGIAGKAVAGPVCPVVRANDPNCNPRPVAGAVIVVKSLDGVEVARAQTDGAGAFVITVPPGSYTVESDRTQGFPVPPAPVAVTVVPNVQTDVELQFDTGIR